MCVNFLLIYLYDIVIIKMILNIKNVCSVSLFLFFVSNMFAQQMTVWGGGESLYSRSTMQIDSITFKNAEFNSVIKQNGMFF